MANERLKVIMDGLEPVRSVDEAKLPTAPSYPNVEKNMMIGFIVGFGVALLVIIILYILDDTIKTPDDIENRLGVSVLAAIPLKSSDHSRDGYGYGYATQKKTKKKDKKKKKTDIEDGEEKE